MKKKKIYLGLAAVKPLYKLFIYIGSNIYAGVWDLFSLICNIIIVSFFCVCIFLACFFFVSFVCFGSLKLE